MNTDLKIDTSIIEEYKQGLLNSTVASMIRHLIDSIFRSSNGTLTKEQNETLMKKLPDLLNALNITTLAPKTKRETTSGVQPFFLIGELESSTTTKGMNMSTTQRLSDLFGTATNGTTLGWVFESFYKVNVFSTTTRPANSTASVASNQTTTMQMATTANPGNVSANSTTMGNTTTPIPCAGFQCTTMQMSTAKPGNVSANSTATTMQMGNTTLMATTAANSTATASPATTTSLSNQTTSKPVNGTTVALLLSAANSTLAPSTTLAASNGSTTPRPANTTMQMNGTSTSANR
jgi:hypothetical protein